MFKKKTLNKKNLNLTLHKDPHAYITPFITKLVLPIKTHMVIMVAEIALDNSQYF
jgi:hypothetical protein